MKLRKKVNLSLVTIALLAGSVYAQDKSTLADVTIVADSKVTENSDSYTIPAMSSATKMNLSILDTPQSVSVITSEQMEDFGLTTIDDVLKSATGIDVSNIEKDRTYFTSRGFTISNILLDGVGGSITSNIYINGGIDMALYDHVEITRGATGLSSNNGDPSATINLVRKKPTKELQGSAKVSFGSWNKKRLEGDISGSITDDNSFRVRLMGAVEKSDSFTDRYDTKSSVFGLIVEKDINDNNLLTASISRTERNSDGVSQGGMDAVTAQSKDYNVATSAAPDWGFRDVETTEISLKLESNLSDATKLKTTYSHREVKHDAKFLTVWNDNDGKGTYLENFSKTDEDLKEDLLDVSLNSTYTLNGLEHDFIFGFSLIQQKYTDDLYTDRSNYGTYVDLDSWDGSTATPDFSADPTETDWKLKENSIYLATNYNILDNLSFLAGTKVTRYTQDGINGGEDYHIKESSIVTPYASILYKPEDYVSMYLSYTTTFDPQSNIYEDGTQLDPEEGTNTEIGIKSSLLDNRLNVALSMYKTKQNNFAVWAGYDSVNSRSYYNPIELSTRGFDIEIAGKLTDTINALIGYTNLMSVEDENAEDSAESIPRNLFKASITYSPTEIVGLKIGASAIYQSKTNDERDEDNAFYIEQESYTLYNVMSSYEINKNAKVSLNINNITNEKYYNALLKPYVTYGAPRSFEVSFAYKF